MNSAEILEMARFRAMCASGAARSVRRARHVSLREAGGAVGVGAPTILRWERSERVPRTSEAALKYWALLQDLMAGA